jgi:hypothetical protein
MLFKLFAYDDYNANLNVIESEANTSAETNDL